jgi:Ca2+-binding EF-hand superfamily protein
MLFKKMIFIVCCCVLIAAPSFAQGPPGDAPQGPPGDASQGPPGDAPEGGGGGGGMPQTKAFNVDDFVAGVDADKDGFMTKEEFAAVGLTDRMFLTPPFCDPDHDEKISKEEMGECKLPSDVDMNKDGKLTLEEVVTFEGTDLGKERGPGEAAPE